MDLSVKTVTYGVGDHRWLGSSHGTDMGETGTLDVSTLQTEHYTDGFVPSGTCLALNTSSGLYQAYDENGANATDIGVGHLLTDTPCDGTADVGIAVFTHGVVIEAFLPDFTTTDGEIDAGFKVDVAGRIRYR
jgi:hypothetical protein